MRRAFGSRGVEGEEEAMKAAICVVVVISAIAVAGFAWAGEMGGVY
jgi:hypothetical protein